MRLNQVLGFVLVVIMTVSVGASCASEPVVVNYPRTPELNLEESASCVVQVKSYDEVGRAISGSGVVIGLGSTVVTASHMLEAPFNKHFVIARFQGGSVTLEAKVIRRGERLDWALLSVEVPIFPDKRSVPLYRSMKDPPRFARCLAIGYALGFDSMTLTEGRIQNIQGGCVRFSAPIIYGNSGGALIVLANGKPALLGIVYAGCNGNGQFIEHMGLAVDVRAFERD